MSSGADYPPLGAYEPLALLGRGGMAEVFRVRHKLIGSEFALKRMLPELAAEPSLKALFEEELTALVKLRHPNIVDVHDVFSAEDGAPVIVMELVLAPSLRKVIAQRALSVDEILGVAVGVASGLSHAHREGLVHCDLKPDNVLLPESDARRAKIIDFGIARLARSRERSTRMGTVPYMAPEQLEDRDVDARTDVFAFGVLLFEMLEGRLPVDETRVDVALKAWRSLALVFPRSAEAPRDLHELCRQCLAFRMEDRPQSAEIVLQRLRYIEATQRAFVDSSWNRRAPVATVSLATGSLLLVLAAVTALWWWTRPPAEVPAIAPPPPAHAEAPSLVPIHPHEEAPAPAQVLPHKARRRVAPACANPPCPVPQRLDETEDLTDPNAEDESLAGD